MKTDMLVAAVKQAGYKSQAVTDKTPAKDSKKAALYKCESCGKTYGKAGSCCGAPIQSLVCSG